MLDLFNKHIQYIKIGVLSALICLSTLLMTDTAWALSGRISFSDPTATVGSELSVTMKVNSLDAAKIGSTNIMLSYDANALEFISGDSSEGGAGSISVKGSSGASDTEWVYQLKFKALTAGESNISISTWEVYDADGNLATIDDDKLGSSKITVQGAEGSSTDASLSTLEISPGVLNPAFSADVSDYTTTVGSSADKIAVSAVSTDPNAKIAISGNSELVLGENTIEIKVTAQDGSTEKIYKILVNKLDGEYSDEMANVDPASALSVTIDDKTYSIADVFDPSIVPEGFTQIKYLYNSKEVNAARYGESDVLLLYLIAPDGSGSFYVYDEVGKTFAKYLKISVSSRSITLLPKPDNVEVPKGFTETSITINGKQAVAWVWAATPIESAEYCIVYAMNADGNKGFYRYDTKDKTVQRYFADPSLDTDVSKDTYESIQAEYNKLKQLSNIKTYAIIALLLLCAIAAFFLIRLKSGSKQYLKKKGELDSIDERLSRDDDVSAPLVHSADRRERDNQFVRDESMEDLYLMQAATLPQVIQNEDDVDLEEIEIDDIDDLDTEDKDDRNYMREELDSDNLADDVEQGTEGLDSLDEFEIEDLDEGDIVDFDGSDVSDAGIEDIDLSDGSDVDIVDIDFDDSFTGDNN